jgi:hypothetical protein
MFIFTRPGRPSPLLVAKQFGDEVLIPEVPIIWVRRLEHHLLAAGFDGRRGGPVGVDAPAKASHATIHIHNASASDVRSVLASYQGQERV